MFLTVFNLTLYLQRACTSNLTYDFEDSVPVALALLDTLHPPKTAFLMSSGNRTQTRPNISFGPAIHCGQGCTATWHGSKFASLHSGGIPWVQTRQFGTCSSILLSTNDRAEHVAGKGMLLATVNLLCPWPFRFSTPDQTHGVMLQPDTLRAVAHSST